ncbi:3-isopropylmalate dehydratase large subunit [Bacillus sp. B15-48]|uniref:3-isopropylmalate dehydratase large subunit n=1 Tax=Bacillus sp. B15-48 TaxID=1548601 RepID=UPI00193EDC34|nr:3-isopropylmalate dehydratase large subunit [Bacillus sp. B15-48]MBM4762473.1 3-isopropylmalate dehydratase large subunit [Bacillus sp. B15-48]
MVKTIIDKLWENHIVHQEEGKPDLLYIDLHLVHEVTSPQAFSGLRMKNRKVRRPDLTFATVDHNVPTINRMNITDPVAKKQMDTLRTNCEDYGIELADLNSPNQGIVHVIGPELGLTQPGKTIVCGDSHTSTHGAFGALAFGIGTSEVEHVLATQTIWQSKPKTLKVQIDGELGQGVLSKDVILYVLAKHGVNFGTGHIIEYCGEVIRNMTMEERMTVCNMSIEGGARAGLVAPDDTTVEYLRGRQYVPDGPEFEALAEKWKALASDEGAVYDQEIYIDGSEITPMVSWGTNPGQTAPVTGRVPYLSESKNENDRRAVESALTYMDFTEGQKISDINIQKVFIGSCTNSRLEDLRKAAAVAKGRKVQQGVQAIVVPGSQTVKMEAEAEGLDKIFLEAGFEWRESGCSMCLSMNADVVPAGEHCASTSNRNFEGRQGAGARTHLVSPAMAAAAAVHGHFVDVRNIETAELV